MIFFIIFFICLIASITGAISGIGGGIIIKPLLDATNLMSISAVNFLSGCTVLAMSAVSLLRNRKGLTPTNLMMSTFLGIGAAFGGVFGKELFEIALNIFSNYEIFGAIQSACLLIITLSVFLYIHFKESITSKHLNNPLISVLIGFSLGFISSFLGIGGGPLNIAVLYYFFSMNGKTAALNSLCVIFISQVASLISAFASNKIPGFDPFILILMIIGGLLGAEIGFALNKKITDKQVEIFFSCVLLVIAMINIWNIARYVI